MGMYINPPGERKESWLAKHTERCIEACYADDCSDYKTTFPICLVDNGAFKAAGICFDEREFECFSLPDDERPKEWFVGDVEVLASIAEDFAIYIKEMKIIWDAEVRSKDRKG